MPEKHIGLCHRSRLLGECLAESLMAGSDLMCVSYPPDALASSGSSALSALTWLELLLLDASLKDDLTSRIVHELQIHAPHCRLILLVAESAVEQIVELARLNCQGCLFEEVSLIEVQRAITTVLDGRTYCSPELANSLLVQIGRVDQNQSWGHFVDDVQLTIREREILRLIAWENLCNKQIARRLNVSLYTIKNHVHNLIEKLGVADRHEAVQVARRRRLLSFDGCDSLQPSGPRLPR